MLATDASRRRHDISIVDSSSDTTVRHSGLPPLDVVFPDGLTPSRRSPLPRLRRSSLRRPLARSTAQLGGCSAATDPPCVASARPTAGAAACCGSASSLLRQNQRTAQNSRAGNRGWFLVLLTSQVKTAARLRN